MFSLHINPKKRSGRELLPPNWASRFRAAGKLAQRLLLCLIVLTAIGCDRALPKPQQEHVLWKASFPLAFSPDGKRLLTRTQEYGKTVKVWDLRTGKELSEFSGPEVTKHPSRKKLDGLTTQRLSIGNFLVSPTGTLAASLEDDYQVPPSPGPISPKEVEIRLREGNVVLLWDTVTGKLVRSVPVGVPGEGVAFAFSPDGKLVALTDALERVRLIDVETGKVLPSPQFPLCAANSAPPVLTHLAFSPDGKRLACGQVRAEGGAVSVWELASEFASSQRVWECQLQYAPISLAYSPDGRMVAVIEQFAKTIHVWDAADGEHHFTLGGQDGSVRKIAFHPNGRYLASIGTPATYIWDLQTRKLIHTLDHASYIDDVSYSPDGKRLATACRPNSATPEHSEECFVIVWNMQPTKESK